MKRRPDTQDGSTVHRGTSGIMPRDEDPPRPIRYRREAVDQQHRDIIPGVAGRQYQRGDFPTIRQLGIPRRRGSHQFPLLFGGTSPNAVAATRFAFPNCWANSCYGLYRCPLTFLDQAQCPAQLANRP
jgi:hypothetical protein